MEIVPYTPRLLPELAALANNHLSQVPPGWILPEEVVAGILAHALDSWSIHYPEETWEYTLETLCVTEQGHLAAAVQWMSPGDTKKTPEGEEQGYQLQWAFCLPGQDAALRALLEELVHRLHPSRRRKLSTGRFSFGVGWLGIPTCWPHILQGLEAAGFRAGMRWVLYTLSTADQARTEISLPHLPRQARLDWRERPESLEWDLALREERSAALIGECSAWGIPLVFQPCEGYAQWMTIEWLGIEEPYRRRGFARWLMAEMVRRQSLRGVQHFFLWTESNNTAARRLWESLGFQAHGECQEFETIYG